MAAISERSGEIEATNLPARETSSWLFHFLVKIAPPGALQWVVKKFGEQDSSVDVDWLAEWYQDKLRKCVEPEHIQKGSEQSVLDFIGNSVGLTMKLYDRVAIWQSGKKNSNNMVENPRVLIDFPKNSLNNLAVIKAIRNQYFGQLELSKNKEQQLSQSIQWQAFEKQFNVVASQTEIKPLLRKVFLELSNGLSLIVGVGKRRVTLTLGIIDFDDSIKTEIQKRESPKRVAGYKDALSTETILKWIADSDPNAEQNTFVIKNDQPLTTEEAEALMTHLQTSEEYIHSQTADLSSFQITEKKERFKLSFKFQDGWKLVVELSTDTVQERFIERSQIVTSIRADFISTLMEMATEQKPLPISRIQEFFSYIPDWSVHHKMTETWHANGIDSPRMYRDVQEFFQSHIPSELVTLVRNLESSKSSEVKSGIFVDEHNFHWQAFLVYGMYVYKVWGGPKNHEALEKAS